MTFRCAHLGIVVPRSNETEVVRRSIWRTHAAHNLASWEFDQLLLLMRGEPYDMAVEKPPKPPRKGKKRLRAWEKRHQLTKSEGEDTVHYPRDRVRRDALLMAREAQRRNGGSGGDDEEVLSLLRVLYEAMVPSSVDPGKGEGEAQKLATAYVGNLCVQGSRGNLDCARLAAVVPTWLVRYREWAKKAKEEKKAKKKIPSSILSEATSWLESEECRSVHWVNVGRTPTWKKKIVKDEEPASEWIPLFDSWLEKQADKAGSVAPAILRLDEIGVLPLMDGGPVYRLLHGRGGGKSVWDLGALKDSLSSLSSWESWNARTGEEYSKVVETTRLAAEELSKYRSEAAVFEKYERTRCEELSEHFGRECKYHLTRKQVKGWNMVRSAWTEVMKRGLRGKRLEEALVKEVSRVQGDLVRKHGKGALRTRFGDHHLFRWLAKTKNHKGWISDEEALWKFASFRSAQARQRLTKSCARYRAPCPRTHPRWCEFAIAEKSGGLPKFQLKEAAPGKLVASLPLLYRTEGGLLEEGRHWFRLAPSRQIRDPLLQEGENRLDVSYRYDSLGLTAMAEVRNSTLVLDRKAVEGMSEERVEAGDVKAKLAVVLDVVPQCPADWLDKRGKPQKPPLANALAKSLGNGTIRREDLKPGLRVFSCNLNHGCNAVSVFELMDLPEGPGNKLAYHVHGTLWGVHERSHVLFLPGEKPTASDRRWRNYLYANVKRLERRIRDMKELHDVVSSCGSDEDWLDKVRKSKEGSALAEFAKEGVRSVSGARDRFEGQCRDLANAMSDWVREQRPRRVREKSCLRLREKARRLLDEGRKEEARAVLAQVPEQERLTEPKDRESTFLLSLEGIEYLERCLRLYKSWQKMLGRDPSEGKFHAYLWDHVTNLKQERVRLLSSKIVRAAMGYDSSGVRQWDPCRVILFEDKSRYQFRSDRPKAENRGLMAWCHRAIETTVRMRSEVHGIFVPEKAVNAGYVSRFDAVTGAPGIRCARLRNHELTDEVLTKLGNMGFHDVDHGAAATLVPREGGNLLASPAPDGGLRVVNAEINAAWNIQKRFWTRHADVYRIPVAFVKEEEVRSVFSASMGKRLEGAVKKVFKGTSLAFGKIPNGSSRVPMRPKKTNGRENPKRSATSAFRDPSFLVLDPADWYLSDDYWALVTETVVELLLEEQAREVVRA